MKYFLKKFLIFFLLIPVVWIVLLMLWGTFAPRLLQKNIYYRPAGNGHTLSRLREADTVKNIDILVLGSSHAYRGIDPRIFKEHGIRLFNLGTSSQTPIQTSYLLDTYLDKLKPKVILYEVFYSTFQTDGVESALDMYSNRKKLDEGLFSMALKLNNVKSYNTLAYVYVKNLLFKNNRKEAAVKGSDTYVKGGYVERTIKTYAGADDNDAVSRKFEFNQDQLAAFEQILSKLKKRGIPVVLLQAPITKGLYNATSNLSSADKYFSAAKTAGYYNFNTNPIFVDSDFFDKHHLNQNGVNKFDKVLIDSLRTNKSVAHLFKK